jgi:tetratricopeptide (TPR) repeat protein
VAASSALSRIMAAILYELLTGRPPFRAATAAETVQQVISQEPAPPARLNDKVPRDLETICLKCLHKEPGRRYASAAALADDLRRFGEGRPIQARPVSQGERLWRWGRRNPTAAALLATALALVGLASGGGVWLLHQQAERRVELARLDADLRNEIRTAVAQAASLRKGFHFREARELLEQARQRLEPTGPDELRRQVEQAQADLNLAERLDAARTEWATLVEHEFKPAGSEALYESAFAAAGLGREGDDVEGMAARVRDSAASAEIVAALDDWAQAAEGYTRALKHGPTDDGHFWFEYAALLLLSGDRAAYVKACVHLVDRCGKAKGPRSYHVARACTLAPDAVADMSLPGRLAEKELKGSREFWSLTEQGALAYRAGRFQETASLFEQSLRANPKPGAAVLNWLWLALAHQRLGNVEEAQHWLGKAQAWLDQYGDGMPARAEAEVGLHLHNWLEAHVLRREAEALIQPTGR